MEPLTVVILMVALMLFLIILEMPIAFAIGLSGSLGIVLLQGWPTLLYSIGAFPITRIAEYTWTCIPLYIFLGNLMAASGVATDAYDLANKWLGRLRGGLVLATIGASTLLAATTGSGGTSTAVLGKIAVPEMEKYGYDRSLSTGATASCGPLGILIPPSGSFIIIGVLAELSIGKLFIAGILPGILTAAIFLAMVYVRCTINPNLAPKGQNFSWKVRLSSLKQSWGVIIIFVTIIGGLYTGIATATEVAAIGCFVALLMVFVAIARKRANWSMLMGAILETVSVSAMVFAFVIGAGVFSLFVTLSGIVTQSVVLIQSVALPAWVILVIIIFIYLILGLFFDPLSMVMVTVPIFFPIVVKGLGVDPIWFSVITVIMVEVSALTPPVGLNLFIMQAVYPKASLIEITRGCMWFVAMDFVVIAILFIFPSIATWLPMKMWSS